jgi:hypothetical protein
MLMLPCSLLWTGVVCLCEWLKHVSSAGSLQVIPIRICILLPLLPLPPIWWQARLCLFEENFPWSLHSWGYTPKCWAFEFLGSVSLSIQIVYCAPKSVGPFHEELFLWDFQLVLSHEGCLSRHQGVDHIFIKALLQFGAGFQFDYVFDWTILKYQQSQSTGGPQRTSVGLL